MLMTMQLSRQYITNPESKVESMRLETRHLCNRVSQVFISIINMTAIC